jgi:NAD(P)-dependent dehydrogenase (short-subunit alcohol dehydrogenase family)
MSGKVALVTGAASGIGKAIAQRLAAEDAKVMLADLNETEAKSVADAIGTSGGSAIAIRLDVTSEADWQAAITRILPEWGRLDSCVNCAGIAFAQPITDLDLADWHRVMTTNLDGVFLGTKQAISAMKSTGGGLIINIASAAGIKPIAGNAAYGTSKAAIRSYTQVAGRRASQDPGEFDLAGRGGDTHVGIHGHVAQGGCRSGRAGCGSEVLGMNATLSGAWLH